jgi:hypothetical protein
LIDSHPRARVKKMRAFSRSKFQLWPAYRLELAN